MLEFSDGPDTAGGCPIGSCSVVWDGPWCDHGRTGGLVSVGRSEVGVLPQAQDGDSGRCLEYLHRVARPWKEAPPLGFRGEVASPRSGTPPINHITLLIPLRVAASCKGGGLGPVKRPRDFAEEHVDDWGTPGPDSVRCSR